MNFKKKTRILHPIKDRNQDLSHLRVKLPEEMGKAEFDNWKFLVDQHEKGVELEEDHPLLLVLYKYFRKFYKKDKNKLIFYNLMSLPQKIYS